MKKFAVFTALPCQIGKENTFGGASDVFREAYFTGTDEYF